MAKPSKRGGAREGAGRKPLADDERRDKVFSVRLTTDEMRLLDERDARSWAREVLLRAAKRQKP